VDPKKVGFERPEMHSVPLAGTVKFYEKHMFLTAGDGKKWPAKVEKSAATGLPARLAAAISEQAGDKKINFMLCDSSDGVEGDVLVFPDMVKFRLQPSDDVTSFAKSALHASTEDTLSGEPITGSHVFICTHNSRDARCGYCGPLLVAAFKEAVKERGLTDIVHVRGCSHTGGHKYAGNVIIYREQDGKVEGDWYGYVSPADVPTLLDQHIQQGSIVEKLWRGRMGLTEEQQKEELKRVASSRQAQPSGTSGGTCEGCDCGKAEGKVNSRWFKWLKR
jgi:(2Fe-2S) ferredoxin